MWRPRWAVALDEFDTAATTAADDPNPFARLRAIAIVRGRLGDVERDAVEHAIAFGGSWSAIAESLGISRQAVHKMHAASRAEPAPTRRGRLVDAHCREMEFRAWFERFVLEQERRREHRRPSP